MRRAWDFVVLEFDFYVLRDGLFEVRARSKAARAAGLLLTSRPHLVLLSTFLLLRMGSLDVKPSIASYSATDSYPIAAPSPSHVNHSPSRPVHHAQKLDRCYAWRREETKFDD